MKGNIQFLYNLYDPRDESPYVTRFNVRMGVEFPVRKREKVKDGEADRPKAVE